VTERFPRIQWSCAISADHTLSGERLDRGFEAFEECRANIQRPPSEYLKRFYYDTVNFDPRALDLAIEFAGVDHVLAGSDYPHQIGSIPRMLESIGGLGVSEADKAAIFSTNAARLLNL